MNIIKCEFYKVLSKKTLWFLIIILLILNGWLFIYEQDKKNLPITNEYYKLQNEYSSLSNEEALSKVAKTEEEMSALGLIVDLRSRNINEERIKEQISPMIKAFKVPGSYDELIEKYKDSNFMRDSDSIDKNRILLSLIREQLQYISNYPKFINSMKEKSEEMRSISIFNKPNTFVYRNIVKTEKDFQHLKEISLKLGDQTGVVISTSFKITDIFVMALVFFLCVYLFMEEKEKGLIGLVKANKNGRGTVVLSKLLVLATLAIFISIIFYGSILILGKHIYGFGDTSRYIQSMSDFRNCNILLSVKEYILLFIATKIGVVIISSMVLAMVFILLSDSKSVYVLVGVVSLISYLCYVFIHPISYINGFKYLNVFAFFNTFELYTEYVNINIFGYPISKAIASILVLSIVLVLVISISVITFSKKYNDSYGLISSIMRRLSFKTRKFSGSTNLFFHESYKVMIGSKVYLIIIFALIIGYNSMDFKPLLVDYNTSIYMGYVNTLSGKISPEKVKFIENEQKHFDDIPIEIEKLYASFKEGRITPEELKIEMLKIEEFSKKKKAFQRVKNQYEYLLNLQEKQKISGSFICEISSDYMFNDKNRDLINGLLYTVLLLLSLCSIFSNDYKNGMFSIMKCTRNGKTRLFTLKYLIGYIIAFILMIIVYLPTYINLLIKYNIGDWLAPIQSISIFSDLNMNISILGFIVLVNLLQFISAFVMTGFILMISQFAKNQSLSNMIGTILFVFPFLVGFFGISSISLFTMNNAFTLFKSYAQSGAVTYNIVYFIILIGLGGLSLFLSVYKYNDEDGKLVFK